MKKGKVVVMEKTFPVAAESIISLPEEYLEKFHFDALMFSFKHSLGMCNRTAFFLIQIFGDFQPN